MPRTYRYRDLSFAVADDEEVNFSVEFISDGNTGYTVINVPGDNDPEIDDEGTILLGRGRDLRGEATISFSSLVNPIPEEDEIRVKYKINNQLLVEHANPKSEVERPNVVLVIRFPKK